jgi:hypothetical protein
MIIIWKKIGPWTVEQTNKGVTPLLFVCCLWRGDEACQWLAAGRWFSPGTSISSTNKTDRHYMAEILLKVALNTIAPLLVCSTVHGPIFFQIIIIFYFSSRHSTSHIVAVSFIGGGNRSTWRKPPTCRKSLTSFITSP